MNEDSTQTKEIGADGHREFLKLMVRVDGLLSRLDFFRTAKDPENLTAIAKDELYSLIRGLVVAEIFRELDEYRREVPYVSLYMREIVDGLRRVREIARDGY